MSASVLTTKDIASMYNPAGFWKTKFDNGKQEQTARHLCLGYALLYFYYDTSCYVCKFIIKTQYLY